MAARSDAIFLIATWEEILRYALHMRQAGRDDGGSGVIVLNHSYLQPAERDELLVHVF